GVNREGQRSDGVEHGLWQSLRSLGRSRRGCAVRRFSGGQRFGELAQALINFFEGFGARREKALERYAEISFQNVALPLFRFVGIEVIGGRDSVAALVFRKIH